MDKLVLSMSYYFKGSSNVSIIMIQNEDDFIELYTSFNEKIATVQSGIGLMNVLKGLYENKYA